MGREIHVKAEAGAEFIGIDQILDLVANIPPPTTDDETAKALHKIQKDLTRFDCKDNLMNLIKNKQLVPLSPITLLPVDFSGMDNFLSWSYVASNIVPIKEFTRLCESWHIKVVIEFADDEQQSKAMGKGKDSQANPKQVDKKATQGNCNDIDFSGLLNIPQRIDDWFRVIDDMAKAFHSEQGEIANEAQAWARLWISPPGGY